MLIILSLLTICLHLLEYNKFKEEHANIKIDDEGNISEFIKIKKQICRHQKEFLAFLTSPRYILPFLNSGRLVKVFWLLLQ